MKHPFAIQNGDKVAVLRPEDPRLALKLTDAALEIEDDDEREKAFRAVLGAQPYSFVGLLSTVGKPEKKLLSEDGWAIGSVRLGDAGVSYAEIFAPEPVAQAIASGDGDPAIVTGEEAERGNVLKYEVQQDGTLGPVGSGA